MNCSPNGSNAPASLCPTPVLRPLAGWSGDARPPTPDNPTPSRQRIRSGEKVGGWTHLLQFGTRAIQDEPDLARCMGEILADAAP